MAALHLSGSHRTDVHINGRLLKRAIHWVGDYEIDLLDHLKPGKNVLALHANDKDGDLPAIAAALCLRPVGCPASADTFQITGPAWRARPNTAPAEWTQVWFDDRSWLPAASPATEPRRRPPPPPVPRSVVLSKAFQLDSAPQTATARVTGLGLYHLRINGQPATDQVLTPGWTEYHLRLEYQTLDLAGLLRAGENTIELTLGNGWWWLHHRSFLENPDTPRNSRRPWNWKSAWQTVRPFPSPPIPPGLPVPRRFY